ncbi:MAG: nucleoside transporter C-terminal domain-containing protein [Alphaproteobacteria bacterium]
MLTLFQPILGLVVFMAICYVLSENRQRIDAKFVAWGLGLQFILALVLLKLPVASDALALLAGLFNHIGKAAIAGTSFVFGYIGGGAAPFEVTNPAASYVFAFQTMPTVFLISAIASVLWYLGWLQAMIGGMAWVFQRTMGLSGPVAFAGCANVFFAMTEAIAMIAPTLKNLNRSELMQVMTVGMTTVASSMFLIYSQFMAPVVPNAMVHVLTASFIHLPAGLLFAHILVPPLPKTMAERVKEKMHKTTYAPSDAEGVFDAFFRGALNGIPIVVNCVVVLIAVLAVLHVADALVLAITTSLGFNALSLAKLLAFPFAPLAWLMGVPLAESLMAGELLGVKTVFNEFVALMSFSQLAGSITAPSALILSYALVSFANIGTAGIMAGSLYALIPEKRKDISELSLLCIVAGLFATLSTGAIMAILLTLGIMTL